MMELFKATQLLIIFLGCHQLYGKEKRSFKIDYKGNQFLKDNEPFRYISGSIHYFRVHPSDWRDRLSKLRHAGFNTVQTYIEWSSHEPWLGIYNFDGFLDLEMYLSVASELGLNVILRPGPYIDSERDLGGLPYWLLKLPGIKLRTSDPLFTRQVERWFGDVLYPKIKPYLYQNGGPIIMIQIENEYGSYPACDLKYTSFLRDLAHSALGEEVVLFTTDGYEEAELRCGKIPGVYATVDFGPGTNVTEPFSTMRLFEPSGPLVNSEYYPGWLDHWGHPHSTRTSEEVSKTLDDMLAMGASVNIYPFHGGTSFNLKSGANIINNKYLPCVTSYDFDAVLTEAGDITDKYYAIRNITKKYTTLPIGPVPPSSPKYGYGKVQMNLTLDILDLIPYLARTSIPWPMPLEALDFTISDALLVYVTKLTNPTNDPEKLVVRGLHDRAWVFIDNEFQGTLSRQQNINELPVFTRGNQTLQIAVENQGRVCFGPDLIDFKGITSNVTLGGNYLKDWKVAGIPLEDLQRAIMALLPTRALDSEPAASRGRGLLIYVGSFNIPHISIKDTFLNVNNWRKGIAWVNNFCLGRYWPVAGPQITLYIPRHILNEGPNSIMLLELEESPCNSNKNCFVTLQDVPVIDGPTPTNN